jgi:hypothetical protein
MSTFAIDPESIDAALLPFSQVLVEEAENIHKEGLWKPLMIMIDKSHSEFLAIHEGGTHYFGFLFNQYLLININSVWGENICVCLCQFHVMQVSS